MIRSLLIAANRSSWIKAGVGTCCTAALHGFMLLPLLFNATRAQLPADAENRGLGATRFRAGEEFSSTLVLLDLSNDSGAVDRAFIELSSRGSDDTERVLRIYGDDPLPRFMALEFEQEQAPDLPVTPAMNDASFAGKYGIYTGQVSARIERAWVRPNTRLEEPFSCQVRIEQDATGHVDSIELLRCNGDSPWQLSLVAAIERASPLSAPSDPAIFTSQLILDFSEDFTGFESPPALTLVPHPAVAGSAHR